jgi:hypothetical protein
VKDLSKYNLNCTKCTHYELLWGDRRMLNDIPFESTHPDSNNFFCKECGFVSQDSKKCKDCEGE